METSSKLPDNAWAMSTLSNGSRRGPGARGVFDGDWQFLEVLSSYCPGHVEGQRCRFWKFVEPMFRRDFPGRRRADYDVITVILDCLPRR